MSSSVERCCLLALVLAGTAAPGVRSADADDRDTAVRSLGPLCTSADPPATCLFKGLLKGVLMYTTRSRHDAAAEKASVDKYGEVIAGADGTTVRPQSKGVEEYLFEQIQNMLTLFSFGFELPAEITAPWTMLKSSFLDGRAKRNKNLGPMLAAGAAVIGGTLLPLAFGALVMLAGKAIMTSLLALTISGMLGLKELMGGKHGGGGGHYKTYASAAMPPAHYSEAQYEQELGVYKGQTESKSHNSGYYAGDSNLAAYYRGTSSEQQFNGSDDQPEYYAGPKFHRHGDVTAAAAAAVDNNVVSSNSNRDNNNNNNVVTNGNHNINNKLLADRIG